MNTCEFKINEIGIGQKFLVTSPRGDREMKVTQVAPRVVLEPLVKGGKRVSVDYERFVRNGSDRKGRLHFIPLSSPPPVEPFYGEIPECAPVNPNVLHIQLIGNSSRR